MKLAWHSTEARRTQKKFVKSPCWNCALVLLLLLVPLVFAPGQNGRNNNACVVLIDWKADSKNLLPAGRKSRQHFL